MRFWRFFAIGLLSVFLLAIGIFGWVAADVYEDSLQTSDRHADAAIVLGAAAWGNRPSPVLRERLNHAIQLYRSGQVDWLVLTGGTPKAGYPTEAEVGYRYALKQGIPIQAILMENQSRDTWVNLANAKQLGDQFGIRTWLVVSDPLHMKRAVAMANDQGMQAYPSPTPTSKFTSDAKQAKFLIRETWNYLAYQFFSILS